MQLTLVWIAVAAQVRVWVGCKTSAERSQLFREAWLWTAPPIVLWMVTVLALHGVRLGSLACLLVWLTGWSLLRFLPQRNSRLHPGLLALWTIFGIGMSLQGDLTPSMQRDWSLIHGALGAFCLMMIALACLLSQEESDRVERFLGPGGVKTALTMAGLAFVMSVLPIDQVKRGAWVLAMLASLLGFAIVWTRTAQYNRKPGNWRQQWKMWRAGVYMAAIPTAVLVQPLGGTSDFAPALVLGAAILTTGALSGQKKAAVTLFATSLLVGYFCYAVAHRPFRLVTRVHDVLLPAHASSEQQMQALWSCARGGLLGRGCGHYILVNGACACSVGGAHLIRPAVVLPTTDGILSILGETHGLVGLAALTVLVLLAALWLWEEARCSSTLCRRAWFGGVWAVWLCTQLFTLGWAFGRFPVIGLAAPLTTGGWWTLFLWSVVIAVSVVLNLTEEGENHEGLFLIRVAKRPVWERSMVMLPVTALIFTAYLWTGGVQYGLVSRTKTLTTCFTDRKNEDRAWEAILRGAVQCKNKGNIVVNPKASFQDLDRRRVEQWISARIYQSGKGDGQIAVRPGAFRQSEPSGLGTVLRLAGKGK